MHACDGTRSACLVPMPVRCARGYTIRSASSSPVWPCRGHALTGSCSCSRSGSRPTPRTRSCAARPKRFARFSPLWTAICRDDRRQVLSTYRALLAESIRDGIHSRDDLTAYIAREDAVFRGFLTHLHELGSSDVADIACDTERCCSQVFLAAGRGEIAWRDAMLFLAMRTGRRLIQNAHTCIDDIRNRRVKTPQQACAYIWMLLQPYASMDGLCLALLRKSASASTRSPRRPRPRSRRWAQFCNRRATDKTNCPECSWRHLFTRCKPHSQ